MGLAAAALVVLAKALQFELEIGEAYFQQGNPFLKLRCFSTGDGAVCRGSIGCGIVCRPDACWFSAHRRGGCGVRCRDGLREIAGRVGCRHSDGSSDRHGGACDIRQAWATRHGQGIPGAASGRPASVRVWATAGLGCSAPFMKRVPNTQTSKPASRSAPTQTTVLMPLELVWDGSRGASRG